MFGRRDASWRRLTPARTLNAMKKSQKPVRRCHACRLNLGDSCWIYLYPRGQWGEYKRCPGLENEDLYEQYEEWLKAPSVKTRKELRREFFRTRKRKELHYDPVPSRNSRTGTASRQKGKGRSSKRRR